MNDALDNPNDRPTAPPPPTKTMKELKLSFNQWLAMQTDASPHFALANVWESRRGRLTRKVVCEYTQARYGMDPAVGNAAWDAYFLYLVRLNP